MGLSQMFLLGIDGGGTNCRAQIRDIRGELMSSAELRGPGNVYQNFEVAIKNIRAVAETAAIKAGLSLGQLCAGLGLAGVLDSETAQHVCEQNFGFAQITVTSDSHIACLAAHGGMDGGIVISGTGSGAYGIKGDEVFEFGSMGLDLGDDGSGAMIGKSLLRLSVRAMDGLAPMTPMLQSIIDEFSGQKRNFLRFASGATSSSYGEYCERMAFRYAELGDSCARTLLEEASFHIDELCQALLQRGITQIALIGSVANRLEPKLSEATKQHLIGGKMEPVDGAVMLARKSTGLPTSW